jgi:hypothetical protein
MLPRRPAPRTAFSLLGALGVFACALACSFAPTASAAEPPVAWFSTGGETIYHLRGAHTAPDATRSIITAAYSGKILCFDHAGKKRWEQSANRFFPYALDAGDLDGDGLDESVVASADSSLYLIAHDGRLIAKVTVGPTPLYAAKIVTWGDGKKGIVCGGPERVLYHVSPAGKIVSSVTVPGAVSALAVGRHTPGAPASLVVKLSLDYNAVRLTRHTLPALEPIGAPLAIADRFQYNLLSLDADGDGRDEFALGSAHGGGLYRATGEKIFALQERRLPGGDPAYPLVILDKIPAPDGRGEALIGLFASTLRLYGPDGKIRREVNLPDSLAGLCYDAASRTLLLGSGVSGDDCVYRVRLDQPGWGEALAQLRPKGQLRQIVANLHTFAAQVAAFQPPAYQIRAATEEHCVVAAFSPYNPGTVAELEPARSLAPLAALYRTSFPYPSLSFAGNQWLSEDWDRSHLLHGWAKKRDPRMKYRLTRKEIVDHARRLEREGLPFVWTIGHGNDPFFLSLGTAEEILQVAPTACRGFIFPRLPATIPLPSATRSRPT